MEKYRTILMYFAFNQPTYKRPVVTKRGYAVSWKIQLKAECNRLTATNIAIGNKGETFTKWPR